MNEKQRIEQILQRRNKRNYRNQNLAKYFHWLADKHHLPWVREMVAKFKEVDGYPLIPCRDLALCYTDSRDREIAAFMGYALVYKGDYAVIKEAKEELGEHPWEWFVNRGFVRLSVGDLQDQKTCGQTNWKIAQMFHLLHKLYSNSECATLGEAVSLACRQTLTPLHQFLEHLLQECDFKHYEDELRVLILVLSAADGIGLSLWVVNPLDVQCPLTLDVKAFLRLWWPNALRVIPLSEQVSNFGLSDSDLFIASMAYKRLKAKFPDGCARYERIYRRWFERGTQPREVTVLNNLPKIDF